MKIRNWNFNLFNVVGGAVLAMLIMTIGTQLASGSPQPLSPNQLQAVTGGGECEDCRTDDSACKTQGDTTCKISGSGGGYVKRVWTGQDIVLVDTDLDSGYVDVDADTPENCYERWSGCDKVNGSCVNCDTTSTTGKVNSNCRFQDPTECPAS